MATRLRIRHLQLINQKIHTWCCCCCSRSLTSWRAIGPESSIPCPALHCSAPDSTVPIWHCSAAVWFPPRFAAGAVGLHPRPPRYRSAAGSNSCTDWRTLLGDFKKLRACRKLELNWWWSSSSRPRTRLIVSWYGTWKEVHTFPFEWALISTANGSSAWSVFALRINVVK